MIIDIVMPKMGESITEGTILEWRKKVGEFVEKDELFLEIGTDKVDSEIPCVESGTLVEILAEVNEVVDVGKTIAKIETKTTVEGKNNTLDSSSKEKELEKVLQEKIQTPAEQIVPSNKNSAKVDLSENTANFLTRAVMKAAREKNISTNELGQIKGTGRKGRVTKKDILNYSKLNTDAVLDLDKNTMENTSFAVATHTEEMDNMRKIIADHMKKSLDTAAHVHVVNEINMTQISNYIKNNDASFIETEGFNLTYTPFILDAVIKALKEFPEMNASINNTAVTYHKNINLGIAVALDSGLIVPVMYNCEEKNFLGLCRSLNDIASRSRSKKINPDELSGSTFSISNFGVFDVTIGTPIINQPNVGILGVGAVKKRAVVVEHSSGDSIGIQSMMNLSLGFDHRLIDGSGGARFINAIKKYIESSNLENLY
ncbi:MAG: dihydrolipoamide acetyltransferase family protein [Candidatus Neomarinimicrobiota bacterium]|nr:MAG: 2-oxo acid dehydrogenase subunit E2 [bacterium]